MRSMLAMMTAALLAAGCGANSADSATRLADAFYRQHQALSPTGAPAFSGLMALRPYLSVSLFESLKDVAAAEEDRRAQDLPPLLALDPFTALADPLSSFHVGDCKVDHAEAACPVQIVVDAGTAPAGPVKRTDRVVLQQDARGWVVDDIEFGERANAAQPSAQHVLNDALARSKRR